MTKRTKYILALSMAANAYSALAIYGLSKKVKAYEEQEQRVASWSGIVSKVLLSHLAGGCEMRVPTSVMNDVESYLIFRNNDML